MAAPATDAPKETMRRDYLPPPFLAPSVDIAVKLSGDGNGVSIGSKTTFVANKDYLAATGVEASALDLALDADLKYMTVTSVRINGTAVSSDDFILDKENAKVIVPAASLAKFAPDVASGSTFVAETINKQNPVENHALEGLYMSQGDYCTQMEAEGFRRFMPHLDRPDVLSVYSCTIEAPTSKFNELLSNGNRAGGGSGAMPAEFVVGGLEATSDDSAGLHWARWEHPVPKPCYLFALVAGHLSSLDSTFTTRSGKEVKLRLLAKAEDLPKCQWAMTSLKQAMAWDELRYGREYDLDIFHIVAVASFSMGAMENSSLNVFNVKYVLADERTATDGDFSNVQGVIGHEYFHNWSGNRVTCRDWFQLSLKEGFTVFRDQEFSSDMASRWIKRISTVDILRAYQFAQAAGPMSHPVRPASFVTINNFYSVTVYNGGAEVVRMYPSIVGRGAFRRGTDLYFGKHDGEAVTCDHFCSAIEEANWPALPAPDMSAERAPFAEGEEEWIDPPFQRTGERPLTQFRRWYSVAGTPQVDATVTYDRDARTITVELAQSVPPTAKQDGPKPPLHIPVAVGFLGADGADLPLKLRPDPEAWDQKWGVAMIPVPAGSPEADRDSEMFPGNTAILHLTKAKQEFVFEDVDYPEVDPAANALTAAGLPVPAEPVPSLLRGFSAPVRLHLDGDDSAARLFRLAYDSDPFNRYEAANLIATDLIVAMVPAQRPGAQAASSDAAASPAASAAGGEIKLTAGAGKAATTAFCDAVRVMLEAAITTAAGEGPSVDAGGMDPALVASILALPPHKSLSQETAKRDGGVADPRAVAKALSAIRRALAEHLAEPLARGYAECSKALSDAAAAAGEDTTTSSSATAAAAAAAAAADTAAAGEGPMMSPENKARRALRNACLSLLTSPVAHAAKEAAKAAGDDNPEAAAAAAATASASSCASKGFDPVAAAKAQMASATNMTEEFGAFRCLVRLPAAHPERVAAVDAFYKKWRGENLVEDKWLTAQAVSGDVASVRALMKHEAFDLMIPNKVYSLVRVFAEANITGFYAADGSGFDLLADVVAELDRHNPQVAARIANSFASGRTLPPALAGVMKARVERVLGGESVSKDLKEVLTRCNEALASAVGDA